MPLSTNSQIELTNVSQSFETQQHQVVLFQDLNLSIQQGQSYAIMGPSGSGKSSLLMLASGLEKPTQGKATYLTNEQVQPLEALRKDIGFIFQQFHLLPELDALNNVALPLKLRGQKGAEQKARQWLEKVGLGHRLTHKPKQLSGGEQQRVAIARALVFEPRFIFADEPTGNLDAVSAKEVTEILFSCCKEHGAGLVLVTHSEALAEQAESLLMFKDGQCSWIRQSNQEPCHVQ
ncbi:ABC transporter ATP-binding protein [Lacimicrobium sp. SS2-24]|uniref:ABC transporter ATP-binding protein n=1 Tax=Lacimicrobium sp. SS2-24 TaxID=2005569 RepID=UPI000B4C0E80|nr:ABC transporter ATP-binding protein [Lacimicrobium sp. SS2-24]